jgi:hypothetical protein
MMSRLARPRRTCSESITIFTVSHARGRRSAPTTDPLLHNVQVSPNTLIEMSGSVLSAWTSTIRPIQRFRRRVPRRNQPVSTRTASAGIIAVTRSQIRTESVTPSSECHLTSSIVCVSIRSRRGEWHRLRCNETAVPVTTFTSEKHRSRSQAYNTVCASFALRKTFDTEP